MPRLSYEDVLSYGLVPDNIEEFRERHNPEDESFSFTHDELIEQIGHLSVQAMRIQAEKERIASDLMTDLTDTGQLSVQALARKIGVSRQTLYSWRDADTRRRDRAATDDTPES